MVSEHSDVDDFSSDGEEVNPLLIQSGKKSQTHRDVFNKESDEENEQSEQSEKEDEQEDDLKEDDGQGLKGDTISESNQPPKSAVEDEAEKKTKKLQRIQKLKKAKKSKHKTGVVYLSTIPPYMKPTKMRQILSRFGDIDRLFLKREDEKSHRQRVKSGGNKKIMYVEGWAEFVRKRDAKLCAETLNGNIIGGKKGSFYHDDIMNLKYLPGFKWADLTDQIARENDVRQAKLELEISQANKLNAEYTKNVEKSKMLQNMKNNKKRTNGEQDEKQSDEISEPRKSFKQHKVASSRADAPEDIKKHDNSKDLGTVLNNLL
ncbi:RNA-binding ATPase activator esf2 [Zygosaccharomyces mellis]|uniref:Pre-rRNA-processing protein ESF2 n=1 Tax=Zygosaccharomyces mellis TaxID=42258 RepID=A0A4C2E928_9SACH|nr:RNA-binding ATPase activator esf2 [Zygosaccharomyces mellis]